MSDNKQWSREEGNKSQTYAGATFAGKTTTDTIRNFAEMLIDDIAGNRINTIEEHWNGARRIDNAIAKQVFGGEYSDRIGQAYSKNLTKYQIPEFRKMWDNRVKQGNYLENSLKKLGEHYKLCMDLIELGLSICPNSVNLYLLSVTCCLNYLITDLKNGKVDGTLKVYKKREYKYVKKIAHLNLHNALSLDPQNRTALIYKQRLKEVSEWKNPMCFIATAAYGTPSAGEIDILRNWRDDFLETAYFGKLFIKIYYNLSPPVANNISHSSVKKRAVRALLEPIIKILKNKYSY